MNRAARILLVILGVLIGLALLVVVAFVAVRRSPFPDTDGEQAVGLPDECHAAATRDDSFCVALTGHGLKDTVTIYRD